MFPGLESFSASYAELPLNASTISNIFPFSGPPLYGPSAAGHRPQHPHRPDRLQRAEAEQTPSPQQDGEGQGLAASSSCFLVVTPSSCWTGLWHWAHWFPALAPAHWVLTMHHEEGARRLQVGRHRSIQPGAFLLWKLQSWRPGAQAAACNCFEGSWGDIGCLCSCCHLPLLCVVGSASNPPPSAPVRGAGRFAIPGLPKLLLSVPAGPASALPWSQHQQCQNHYFGSLIREQHQPHLQKSICCCTLCSAPEASKEHTDSPAC